MVNADAANREQGGCNAHFRLGRKRQRNVIHSLINFCGVGVCVYFGANLFLTLN